MKLKCLVLLIYLAAIWRSGITEFTHQQLRKQIQMVTNYTQIHIWTRNHNIATCWTYFPKIWQTTWYTWYCSYIEPSSRPASPNPKWTRLRPFTSYLKPKWTNHSQKPNPKTNQCTYKLRKNLDEKLNN